MIGINTYSLVGVGIVQPVIEVGIRDRITSLCPIKHRLPELGKNLVNTTKSPNISILRPNRGKKEDRNIYLLRPLGIVDSAQLTIEKSRCSFVE